MGIGIIPVNTKWAGKHIEYFDEVDSTNTVAKALAADGASHGTLVVSDTQSAGRGRLGRIWQSPPGSGIYMTLILRPDIPSDRASMLTLICALAVNTALRKLTGLKTMIKWPNDIVMNGKKICGILTEMSAAADHINFVVTGIGINVSTKEFPEDIRTVASSVHVEGGKDVKREQIIAEIMYCFEKFYEKFVQTGDMSLLTDEYEKYLVNKDEHVLIIKNTGDYTGIAIGIDRYGALNVQRDNGDIEQIVSGEVSVRGIYGYA